MSNSRVSNKQLLEAINGLTQAITASMTQQPVAQPAPTVEPKATEHTETSVKLDEGYLNYICGTKAPDFAKSKGEDVVVYARRNKMGEVKLAYCVASRWANLRDNGLIGKVKHIKA